MRDDCIFSRYNFRTRDVIFEDFLGKLKERKINNLNIMSIGSFKLLTELFYLTDLSKAGYQIKEVHLVDNAYSNFMNAITTKIK